MESEDAKQITTISGQNKLNAKQQRDIWAAMELANNYVIDFNLVNAATRCGMDIERAKALEKTQHFICAVQEIVETIEPELVIMRSEVLMGLKKEAFNYDAGSSSASRIKALTELARLLGMDLPTKHQVDINNPVINLTITPPRKEEKPVEPLPMEDAIL